MIRRLGAALIAVVVSGAAAGVAFAGEAQEPPMLTPAVAHTVVAGCPEAKRYAGLLVRGISDAEARAATPLLTACANAIRFPDLRWKNQYAALALAAVQLSQGLLEHDPALLKRAADATRALHDADQATDDQIRSWKIIPDWFDARVRVALVNDDQHVCTGSIVQNAAYVYLAARSGTAWIRTARDVPPGLERCSIAYPTIAEAGPTAAPAPYPWPTREPPARDESVQRPLNPNVPPR